MPLLPDTDFPRDVMTETPIFGHAAVAAPHFLAAEAGRDILAEGGNAIEAIIAMAAVIAVVYPHMNSIGGDGFWLISVDGKAPIAVDGCGAAAQAATVDFYKAKGLSAIPSRGPLAANTVAGTLSGWAEVIAINEEVGGKLPLSRLVEDAARELSADIDVGALWRDWLAPCQPSVSWRRCWVW